ncbi:MAG: aspartyl protease family protein, partial [Bacteroidetes bacterium]|nr:aspartyl protease family protein [Bacteroidota bacterium]
MLNAITAKPKAQWRTLFLAQPILTAILFFSVMLFSRSVANGQEEFVPPPARLLSVLPFRLLNGGIVLVKCTLGNYKDSLNFIFDTGSGGISLDSLTCEKLRIVPVPSDKTIRGIAGIRNVSFVYNESLRLPSLEVDSLNFHVNDYGILTSVYGEDIDGIIGYSFLSRYIVTLDYDSNKIYVYSRGSFKYPKGGFLTRPYIVNLPVETARVRDNNTVSARFYFDTGAGLCLLLSSDFVSDSALLRNKKRKPVETLAQGLGGKTIMKQTTVRDFRLGPYKFHNVPSYIFDDEYNITSYPSLAGLIGNDLLRRFNVILNYGRREIYLMPNSHFRDLFDYSYTGLNIYWVDGEIRASDIIKGSPADLAGFKTGDIIIGVENNFTKNIQAYKNLLQNVGKKV